MSYLMVFILMYFKRPRYRRHVTRSHIFGCWKEMWIMLLSCWGSLSSRYSIQVLPCVSPTAALPCIYYAIMEIQQALGIFPIARALIPAMNELGCSQS